MTIIIRQSKINMIRSSIFIITAVMLVIIIIFIIGIVGQK